MTDEPRPENVSLRLTTRKRVDHACLQFEDAWQAGQRPRIEDYLGGTEGDERSGLLRELLRLDLDYCRQCHELVTPEDYQSRFPEDKDAVDAAFAAAKGASESTAGVSRAGESSQPETAARSERSVPERIGRYLVRERLGEGAFGIVYQAYDPELDRDVALKVPRTDRFTSEHQASRFYDEARAAAQVRHPGIVAIHDIFRSDEAVCVVQEYVAGQDLASWLQTQPSRPDVDRIVQLIIDVAEAVNFAHQRGLVHRDIKPANLLIDSDGRPRVTDFGLALRQSVQQLREEVICGTPPYMSPEQVRGETHRLDGRSDIWSLGAIFFEILTGNQPFSGKDRDELFDDIQHREPKPPRRTNPSLPAELERICLKCLSKRMTDRYATAADLAEDLRRWRREQSAEATRLKQPPIGAAASGQEKRRRIVPRGLRCFDAEDADFFPDLLPGPRDRDGLPHSIRFWKTRMEESDPDKTIPVGLIYGPSGCGKSSLVKAGLLPRLAGHVLPVYVEASPNDTELRLVKGLRKRCPAVPQDAPLPETVGSLREGLWLPAGEKVLIVLDQFEQWLYARQGEQTNQLVHAIRQCDGGRVQCIVLVRSDFFVAASRFMQTLEIGLRDGENSALVDLFDPRHAREVLAEFGRAYGRLPDHLGGLPAKQQGLFLDRAVEGLSEDGRVICVRLALFAEMMKGKPWTLSALKEVGGVAGVGVAFLEETFSATTAPPEHRYHQKAARSVLKALLPESGADIKPRMRPHDELLAVCGYAGRPKDFDALVRILDSETRLITPTDREGAEISEAEALGTRDGGKYYQLTHDYVVGPLREWLTRKQKESRRGRAEIRLAERSAVWNVKPENRHLPAWWEDLNIRLLTRRTYWTESQRRMMRRSGRWHVVRGLVILAILLTLVWGGYEMFGFVRANHLVSNLTRAEIGEVPECIKELQPYRRWADRKLASIAAEDADAKAQLHSSLALVKHDPSHKGYLCQQMLGAAPRALEVICEALEPHKADLTGDLWKTAQTDLDMQRRFNAACALAGYAPRDSKGWEQINDSVSCQLVETLGRNPRDFEVLLRILSPVRHQLAPSLGRLVYDKHRGELERDTALNILVEYAVDQPAVLAALLMEATPRQFARLYPLAQPKSADILPLLEVELRKPLGEKPSEAEKDRLGQRQAQAAIAVLRMGYPSEMWPLLQAAPDPRARSYFIHQASRMDVVPAELIHHVTTEPIEEKLSIQRALLLSLGEFSADQLPAQRRDPLIEKLLEMYERHTDPGLHGAASWLLRRWGQAQRLAEVDQQLKETEDQLRSRPKTDKRHWYVNSRGQTFVIIDAGRFLMGSPETEPGRDADEILHLREIGRTFAIAATEVTRREFRAFFRSAYGSRKGSDYIRNVSPYSRTEVSPAVWPTWYEAVEYCNWLSQQEDIPQEQWCYEPNEDGKYDAGMKPKPDYLTLKGYRLPTEAEWEYACRAGTVTSRYYGSSAELLVNYGRYEANGEKHAWPAAELKPNDFGLFDMLGNVHEWCHDRYEDYPEDGMKPVPDTADSRVVDNHALRVLRGGSFDDLARLTRSAYRSSDLPAGRTDVVGFRPARTFR